MSLKEAFINDFATRSFRDVADRDYIGARILYRFELGQQFLWASLQALEKYLKAILVYNRRSTKILGHDLEKAMDALRGIADIPFSFPPDVIAFVKYLNAEGANRYFEYPAYTIGGELLSLDRAVWYIRRYCFQMRGSLKTKDGRQIDLLPIHIRDINSYPTPKANKYRLPGKTGLLETILSDRRSALREHLVWKNFYYGSYQKKTIKRFSRNSWSMNPTHYLHPEVFDDLDNLIRFSPEVRKRFRKRSEDERCHR